MGATRRGISSRSIPRVVIVTKTSIKVRLINLVINATHLKSGLSFRSIMMSRALISLRANTEESNVSSAISIISIRACSKIVPHVTSMYIKDRRGQTVLSVMTSTVGAATR
jgi:hypothetical protein